MRHTSLLLLFFGSACSIESELFNIKEPEDIRIACENGTTEMFEFLVYFGEQEPACPWSEGDNLPAQDGYVTARLEDSVNVPLPEDAVLCGLELDFDPIGSGQVIEYDDDFFLNMSDVVLLASDSTQVAVLPKEDTLSLFDWTALAGFEIDFGDVAPYCLGEAEDQSTCLVPPDEVPGPIQFTMEQELVDTLSFRTFQTQTMAFSFVTVGDNDSEKDCSHAPYQFMVRLPYTPAPTTSSEP